MARSPEKKESDLKKWRRAADIVWNVFFNGIIGFLYFGIMGLVQFLVLVGIPFGKPYFRFAKYMFHPASYKIVNKRTITPFMKFYNVLYVIVAGWEMYLSVLFIAGLAFISIIYIPIAKQLFHHAKFFFNPRAYTFEKIAYQGVTEEEKKAQESKKPVEVVVKEAPKKIENQPVMAENAPVHEVVVKPLEAKSSAVPDRAPEETPKREKSPAKPAPKAVPSYKIIQHISASGIAQQVVENK
jgi:uncharacterized membrane protein YccF (DUF307 family)